jgi:FAD:protein FMN transferase
MGTSAHVAVVGAPAGLDRHLDGYLDRAVARLEQLEARWSRFRRTSEICALNDGGGGPRIVSDDTALLVERCIEAWNMTAGAFDPTVHDAMVANGYDRDFAAIPAVADDTRARVPARGLGDVVVDRACGLVWLPEGVRLDAGGIGKGLAADLVSRELLDAGAAGVCVNLGGDLRVAGAAPDGSAWNVSIEDPFDASRVLARVALSDGAMATSSRLRRTWTRADALVHHIIDPHTGAPACTPLVAVTAVAPQGWRAEVAATYALLAGEAVTLDPDTSVIVIDESGAARATGVLEEVLACSPR